MSDSEEQSRDEVITVELITTQLQHFTNTTPPCRGMQLPDGILLKHQTKTFFYIRTFVEDGKIKSRVFATDSPYERQKAEIGVISTSMFDPKADDFHLEKLELLLRNWVAFVEEGPDLDQDFSSFVVSDRPE